MLEVGRAARADDGTHTRAKSSAVNRAGRNLLLLRMDVLIRRRIGMGNLQVNERRFLTSC